MFLVDLVNDEIWVRLKSRFLSPMSAARSLNFRSRLSVCLKYILFPFRHFHYVLELLLHLTLVCQLSHPMVGKSKSGFGFKSGFRHFSQIQWIFCRDSRDGMSTVEKFYHKIFMTLSKSYGRQQLLWFFLSVASKAFSLAHL